MSEKRYFVLAFGDPDPDKDRVERGTYTAGVAHACASQRMHGYPRFSQPGAFARRFIRESASSALRSGFVSRVVGERDRVWP